MAQKLRAANGTRPWLFISYRRRFDLASAHMVEDELTRVFGEGAVFRDVKGIQPGQNFPAIIQAALESCKVFLLLVSPGWVEVIEELRDPKDFVRHEVAAALARGIPLIPVLLGVFDQLDLRRIPSFLSPCTGVA